MNYKELFQQAKEKKINSLEIMEKKQESLSLETFDNSLDNYEVSNVTSYLLTGIYNNKKVTISTEELSESILEKIITNSTYLEEVSSPTSTPRESIIYQEKYTLTDPQNIKKRLLALNGLKKNYSKLKNINAFYSETIFTIKIITEDTLQEDVKKNVYFSVEVVAMNENQKSTFYDYKNSTQDNIDMEGITKATIETAISKLECGTIKTGLYNIYLTNKVMGQILRSFIPIFTADTIQKHTSLLENKLHQQVFSDKITIVEDPTNDQLRGKRLFDDEGIKTTYKEIIKDGIFKTILYDKKTAKTDHTKTTGNHYGSISVRNMYLLPGKKPPTEILNSQHEYIIIDEVQGLHAGINITNGNISIQSSGYYVKDNKKTPIKLFVLSTNIIELFNNVLEIANDLENISVTTSSPSVLFQNIKISV